MQESFVGVKHLVQFCSEAIKILAIYYFVSWKDRLLDDHGVWVYAFQKFQRCFILQLIIDQVELNLSSTSTSILCLGKAVLVDFGQNKGKIHRCNDMHIEF